MAYLLFKLEYQTKVLNWSSN